MALNYTFIHPINLIDRRQLFAMMALTSKLLLRYSLACPFPAWYDPGTFSEETAMRYLVLLMLAVLSLAFAPIPFPKPKNEAKNALAVKKLVGTWRISAIYHHPNKVPRDPGRSEPTHIIISPTGWAFKGPAAVSYDLRIDHTKTPGEFDLMRHGQLQPYGRGLIRREGRAIRVIYRWNGARPTSFENEPSGCEMLLLRE
jgi:hypothetical protein